MVIDTINLLKENIGVKDDIISVVSFIIVVILNIAITVTVIISIIMITNYLSMDLFLYHSVSNYVFLPVIY